MRNVKWYHQWWFYLIIVAASLLIGVYGFRERTKYITNDHIQKIVIDSLTKKVEVITLLYEAAKLEKNKIKIVREKIDITDDIKKLEILLKKLQTVQKDTIKRKTSIQDLKRYLETEFY